MSARETIPPVAARSESKRRSALVAAYREGLGLAAVAVIHEPAGIRIAAAHGAADLRVAEARWWCRRRADAERIAAAATARLRRCESRDETTGGCAAGSSLSLHDGSVAAVASAAIASAAKRIKVVLHSDQEVAFDAARIIARVDEEFERLRQVGELKTINRSYRTYRTEASARGEKVLRYVEWVDKYKEKLVRELATALRYS